MDTIDISNKQKLFFAWVNPLIMNRVIMVNPTIFLYILLA